MEQSLSFESFVAKVVPEVAPTYSGDCREDTALFEELGLDSLAALHLLVIIEELADLLFGPDWPSIYTLGEAYTYYTECCRLAAELNSI